MYDIVDVIKNLKTLSDSNTSFKILKDFERVIDELNVYVFKNWDEGELIEGPIEKRHVVTCAFMWDLDQMPDPRGAKRLYDFGCRVVYSKTRVLMPRKITDPEDFRLGTKKGKIDSYPVWVVSITMPKKLMQDVDIGRQNMDDNRLAEILKYSPQDNSLNSLEMDSGDSNAE